MRLTDELLKITTKPVVYDTQQDKIENERLSVIMFGFMRESNGMGLAANQVGIDTSLFVTWVDGKYKAYFNPKLVDWSEELVDFDEGCLSFEGESIIIKRPSWIKLEWQDHKGNKSRAILDGLNARVCLHEYDHLKGITFHQRIDNTDIPKELLYVKT
jgi:peptide deformylase